MSSICEDQELLEGFLAEATELLEKIDDDLVTLEQSPNDMDLLNRIFRSIHTVKGAASFLEFELLVKVTHRTEDVLNKLRRGEMTLKPLLMDVILEAVDLVKILINDIKAEDIKERPVEGTIERLVAMLTESDLGGKDETVPCHESPQPSITTPLPDSEPVQLKSTIPRTNGEELTDKSTVRIDVKRVDDLMNQVGELVLERNRMVQLTSDYQNESNLANFGEELAKLSKRMNFVTSELQMQVLKMRLIPVGNVFKKFPRIVRNLARDLGKQVDLQVCGEETELDRSVVDEISDPLIHLLRNALDHGLESAEERIAAGKNPTGTIILAARHEGNRIIISIKDDGRGIDSDRVAAKAIEKGLLTQDQLATMSRREIFDLIFLPGFSTKDLASDLSGRGVGMDVVRTNIQKLNGIIDIISVTGEGSEIVLTLPLTLAIIQSLLVEVENETYSIPLSAVLETMRVKENDFHTIGGRKVLKLRDTVLPLLGLDDAFNVSRNEKRGRFLLCRCGRSR